MSPAIDLTGYAFGWVLIVPVLFLLTDQNQPRGLSIFMLTTLVTDLHRHYTLPYVYLDGSVRARFPMRFWLLPAVLFALWTQTPALSHSDMRISLPAAGAMLAWLGWIIQLVRQDRGGSFQLRRALPCFLGSVLAGALLSGPAQAGEDIGWAWLGTAVVASVCLHLLVKRDDPGDALAGRRTSLAFPLGITSVAALVAWVPSGASLNLTLRMSMNVVLLSFLFWHLYHVIMQKYGILRIYSAKSGHGLKVPGWVDRLLVWSSVPAVLVWIGGREFGELTGRLAYESPGLDRLAAPLFGFLGDHFTLLMAASGLYAASAALVFLYYEWRVHGLRNAPRLCYALGTILFYGSFFALGFGSFYSAFAFAHGIEYMVFIWAFQRRRYSQSRAQARTLSRLVQHPIAFYASYTATLTVVLFYARYQDRVAWFGMGPTQLFGQTPYEWIRWYTVYQGILHFYYDGFLWKLRRPELTAQM